MSRSCTPSVSLHAAVHAAYVAAGGPPLSQVCREHEEAWLLAQGLDVPASDEGPSVANGGRPIPVTVGGVVYPSHRAAADAEGVTVQAISLRAAKGREAKKVEDGA